MILLDVPFIPEERYAEFLKGHAASLHALHFSLFTEPSSDARHLPTGTDLDTVNSGLSRIQGPKKYALLNSRFYAPQGYFNKGVTEILHRLAMLLEQENVDGIVYADQYLLQALSSAGSEVAARLEAVPSVNCMLDTFDKVTAQYNAIAATNFRPPGKLILDRALNRKPNALAELSRKCRQAYPGIKLALLANEGCLYQCPFKPAHDAHIALANMGLAPENTFPMNSDLGCVRTLAENPALLFSSPFIRPEDVARYGDVVDIIKLCGRTLGGDFLVTAVAAYIRRSHSGNLLDLTDTMEWLAQRLHVANDQLPADFFDRLTGCAKNCKSCSYCRKLLNEQSRPLPFKLKDLRP